ncbi:MAG: osmoprotectant transport system permease protein [Actinomycetota bacterium]|nr:osmoprotectant transport system permease protein [Actinomycetota bacterium]MEA2931684.1 osmoprotectant transport system permease protein [Actinomycetota bacterium]
MTVATPGRTLGQEPEAPTTVAAAEAPPPGHRRRRWLGYTVMPVLLGLACLALYAWLRSKDLDSIERRLVNADVIREGVVEHVKLTVVSTFFVILIAIPLGILLTRSFAKWVTPGVIGLANIGQMVPSIGVLVILALIWTIGFRPAVVALVAYAVLPVLRNTMVGLQQVDRSVIEAGRGMGMTKRRVLTRIELPLAVPVILAGVRTALVINVGAATLATFVNAGGLGDIISGGLSTSRNTVIVTGAVLTAVLALFVDWVGGIVEDLLRPKGL